MEKESLSKLVVEVKNRQTVDDVLSPLFGIITHFALNKIKNQLIKGLKMEKEKNLEIECTCFVRVWRLPCRHTLLELTDKNNVIYPKDVHKRWHIHHIKRRGKLIMKNIYYSSVYL